MDEEDIDGRLQAIFMSSAINQANRIKESGINFVHYTTAEAAVSIIKNNCIWLRNSLLMNDYSEVQHGLACLVFAWHSDSGERLKAILDKIEPGMAEKFTSIFDAGINELMHETYILSISEHGDEIEDKYGRLSMWRAYGSSTSVAVVFDHHPSLSPSDALNAYTMPVFYGDRESYALEFEIIVNSIEKNLEFLINLNDDPTWILDTIIEAFKFSVLSTKHPGFREEREWRVIYSPMSQESERIIHDDVSISGIPQKIYKIPFVNYPEHGFTGATLPEALKRLIIGPISTPYPTYQLLYNLLESAQVSDVQEKITCSNLPIRF